MSLSLNNSKDITCDALYLLDSSNTLQNVLDLIANSGGGGGSGITTLTGGGGAGVTGTATSKNITIDLTAYWTTTYINSLLSGKISTTHESYKIGSGNVDFGAYTSTMKTMTLENSSGVTAVLSVDLKKNWTKEQME